MEWYFWPFLAAFWLIIGFFVLIFDSILDSINEERPETIDLFSLDAVMPIIFWPVMLFGGAIQWVFTFIDVILKKTCPKVKITVNGWKIRFGD